MTHKRDQLRLAAVADLHCTRKAADNTRNLLSAMANGADILLLGGDLCDAGLPEEAEILAREISILKVPVVAVLGNHDYEAGKASEIINILSDAGVNVLDGKSCEIYGVGFAGAKGFAGGFGERALQPWGETTIKTFVHEAIEEALKLESALAALRTPQRIALLHYSPIVETVMGEPPEIFPFLGSSRLEDPLNRYPVAAVFHGHAHRGSPEGVTKAGVRVFNVAKSVLQNVFLNALPFKIMAIDSADSERENDAGS
jgi:Icc-related predicted phosphoesterase